VVVVTHDRSLMARVATRVIEVNAGRVVLYPGGYDDYEGARLARVAAQSDRDEPKPAPAKRAAPAPAPSAGRGAATATQARPDRAAQNAARGREREVKRLERDIEERETQLKAIEAKLAEPETYADGERTRTLMGDYERLRAEVESLWQRLGELG